MKKSILILAAHVLLAGQLAARVDMSSIRRLIDSIYSAQPTVRGIIVHVEAPGEQLSWSAAVGMSDTVSKQPLNSAQPVITASNTKTYVAAAIMKLQEQGRLNIEQSVNELLPEKTTLIMRAAGYKPEAIRVKHLLSHSSGIDDYVNDAYFKAVDENKRRRWTRDEQIRLALTAGKPLGAPEDTFRYADINYLLLTEIIEQKTGKPFPAALRELLDYRGNGLSRTWFSTLEAAPRKTLPLAHQVWSKRNWDATSFDPSWDLYGGGGIFATAGDMAQFFQALFSGRIIHDTAVLALMHRPVMPSEPHHYALGLRVLEIDGFPAYYHGGFWGTDAAYFPDLNASISIVVLEREHRGISGLICKRIAATLRGK